jgi:hypothetical protein
MLPQAGEAQGTKPSMYILGTWAVIIPSYPHPCAHVPMCALLPPLAIFSPDRVLPLTLWSSWRQGDQLELQGLNRLSGTSTLGAWAAGLNDAEGTVPRRQSTA